MCANRSHGTTAQRLRSIPTPLLYKWWAYATYNTRASTRKRTKALLVSGEGIPSRIGTPASWGVFAR
eukprot:4054203-Pyramimonas_sp.AAC.1